jgi:hypothetical protein
MRVITAGQPSGDLASGDDAGRLGPLRSRAIEQGAAESRAKRVVAIKPRGDLASGDDAGRFGPLRSRAIQQGVRKT